MLQYSQAEGGFQTLSWSLIQWKQPGLSIPRVASDQVRSMFSIEH